MYISHLHLVHYRNYLNQSFDFGRGINYNVGKNAQGKTNLLESIYYCSTTKTHRNVDDACCIYEGYDAFRIDAAVIKKNRKVDLTAIFSKSGKNLYLYRNPVKKVSDFVGFVNAIIFSPNDMNIFSAQPRFRRRFMDIELSKCSKTYMFTLNEYYRILKQRNAYLKTENIDGDYLSVLDEKCADLQCIILKQRYKFLHDLTEISQEFYEELANDSTKFSIVYKTFVQIADEKQMKEEIKKIYKNNFQRDLFLKTTEKGIHKDDFMLMIDGKNADDFASQGQKRTILLSLKVGIVKLIEKIINDEPILLLDDVFSELDEERRRKLLDLLPKNIQIFISTTEKIHENYERPIRTILIHDGKIKEEHQNGRKT